MSVKELVFEELQNLSEEKLHKVAEFVAFLNFQERMNPIQSFHDEQAGEAPSLEELLAGITQENIHREIDFGPAVGKEVW